MSIILSALALAATAQGAPPAAAGCQFVSDHGAQVVAYRDTAIGDAGDVIAAFRLDANERSEAVVSDQNQLRYKVRADKNDRWKAYGKTECRNGNVIRIP